MPSSTTVHWQRMAPYRSRFVMSVPIGGSRDVAASGGVASAVVVAATALASAWLPALRRSAVARVRLVRAACLVLFGRVFFAVGLRFFDIVYLRLRIWLDPPDQGRENDSEASRRRRFA